MEKKDKEGFEVTVGPWPGAETEEYRELWGREYMGQFSEPEDTPIKHRTGIAMLDSIEALQKMEIDDPQEFEKVLIRVFEAGARVELGKPEGKVLWNAMTEALGREPTHGENNRFLKAMRDAGWVLESFHVHKVRYLQSQVDASKSTENLALLSLREEHQALIEMHNLYDQLRSALEAARAKLVEQDSVIEKLARGRKVMSC
jgi:hypothetical protein